MTHYPVTLARDAAELAAQILSHPQTQEINELAVAIEKLAKAVVELSGLGIGEAAR